MHAKGYVGLFYFFRTWVISQNQKRPCFCTLTETRSINNSRSKQNKRNPEQPFVDIGKTEKHTRFHQSLSKSLIFQTNNLVSWK